jgi:hypothetical protein
MSTVIQSGFIVDGKVFSTKAEAMNYIRRPKIKAALMELTKNNEALSDFLLDNQDEVEGALDTGTVRRVTKVERNNLAKAISHALTIGAGDKKLAFLEENQDAIIESFRWPSVKRLLGEDKTAAQVEALTTLSDNPELAAWVVANQEAVLESFKAGVEKREVNPAAAEGLAAYRAKKAAEKAAKEAESAQ